MSAATSEINQSSVGLKEKSAELQHSLNNIVNKDVMVRTAADGAKNNHVPKQSRKNVMAREWNEENVCPYALNP